MSKVRVSALAKDLGISSEVLVQVLRSTGVAVKNHSSSVDEEVRGSIQAELDKQRAAIKKKFERQDSKSSTRRRSLGSRAVGAKASEELAEKKKQSEAKSTDGSAAIDGSESAAPRRSFGPRRGDRRGAVVPPTPAREGSARPQQGGGDRPQGGYNRGGQQAGGDRPQGGYNRGGQQAGGDRPQGGYNRGGQQGGGDRPQGGYNRSGPQTGGAPRPQQGGGYNRGGQQGGGYNRGGNAADPKISADMVNKQAEAQKAENATGGKKGAKKKNSKERYKKPKVSEVEMKANIKKTLAKIGAGSTRKKYKKNKDVEEVSTEEIKILEVSEFISVGEFAKMINGNIAEVIAKCLELGLFVTINQRLDFDTIELLAEEFGYEAKLLEEFEDETEEDELEEDLPLTARAPVVTVMGHVDHGKTSLLDYIRSASVASGESGGITQHIASYEVENKKGKDTFLDTPGHEAFSAMRARGSQVTDVVVLIVAADSGVMPQTKEAIDHAKAAEVPMVIAINKVDLPTANPDKIKAELAQYNVLVEDYGGQISCVELSAKTGQGMDDLLELLALETEMLELTATKEGKARGVVIESELDKGKGAVATVLIQRGTLQKGDPFATGTHSGRVREMFNDKGQKIDEAGPSQPVMIIGLSGTPQAGDSFRVMANEKVAREVSAKRRLAEKEREIRQMSIVSLDNLYDTIKDGKTQTINIIVKGDVDGSVEAVAASLEKLSTDEFKVNIILKGVGGVKEADIMLAKASQAIIIGFHINPNPQIREHAREAGVDIRTYRIIYEAVDEVRAAMIGMLAPDIKEEILGQVEIREVYKVSKIGQIAGCMVLSGKIVRKAKCRLIREDIEIADTTIDSLQRHKDQAKEVAEGFECGIMLTKVKEYQVGDRIEVYEEVEVERKTLEVRKPKEEPKAPAAPEVADSAETPEGDK